MQMYGGTSTAARLTVTARSLPESGLVFLRFCPVALSPPRAMVIRPGAGGRSLGCVGGT